MELLEAEGPTFKGNFQLTYRVGINNLVSGTMLSQEPSRKALILDTDTRRTLPMPPSWALKLKKLLLPALRKPVTRRLSNQVVRRGRKEEKASQLLMRASP